MVVFIQFKITSNENEIKIYGATGQSIFTTIPRGVRARRSTASVDEGWLVRSIVIDHRASRANDSFSLEELT